MTPTATRLKARLDDRRRWFHNQWFFKWHHISGQSPVAIDMFDGSTANYSGLAFAGSPRDIYWDAVVRGVRREIVDQMAWIDAEVRNYNRETALTAIDECAGQLASFVRVIRRTAIGKDRILRGDGRFPPSTDAGCWEGTTDADIQAQAEAIKAGLPYGNVHSIAAAEVNWRTRTLSLWNDNQWWADPLGFAFGAIRVVALFAH